MAKLFSNMNTHYCLYKNETLAYVVGGSFAGDAYLKGGMEAMSEIAGTSFLAITADDGKEYNIGKYNVSPATDEQIAELLLKAHPAFQILVELDQLKPKDVRSSIRWHEAKSMNMIPYLLDEGYTKEEIIEFFKENYLQ